MPLYTKVAKQASAQSQVAEGLHALREVMLVTDIISWGTPVGMDPSDPGIRRTLERFAAEVMPQFRDP